MRVLFTVVLITLSLGLYGCAAKGRIDAPPPGSWVRTVEGTCDCDRATVWNAVLLASAEYRFKLLDQAAGKVVTDWKTTVIPHDFWYTPSIRIRQKDSMDPGILVPPKEVHINFQNKRRFLIRLGETPKRRVLVTVTRQMEASYFDGPRGGMVEEVMQTLQDRFDTEEELNTLLRRILDTAVKDGASAR